MRIILAGDRKAELHHLRAQQLPSLIFSLARAEDLLERSDPVQVQEGRQILLAAARQCDRLLETLTALVELEARGRVDLE